MKSEIIRFKGLKKQEIIAEFKGGDITSDAGLLLFREIEKKHKIIKRMSACITDKRESGKVVHNIEEQMLQRVYAIIAGYEDVNDHQELRKDPLFKMLCGETKKDEELSSPSTICRFENQVDRKALVGMSKVMVDNFIESYTEVPKEIILD